MFTDKTIREKLQVLDGGLQTDIEAELQTCANSVRKIYKAIERERRPDKKKLLDSVSALAYHVDKVAEEMGLI